MIHMTINQGLHQDTELNLEQVQVQDMDHALLEFCRDVKENLDSLIDDGTVSGDWDGPAVAVGAIVGTAAQWYCRATKKKLIEKLLDKFVERGF